jgi:FkbM family methyltransferase
MAIWETTVNGIALPAPDQRVYIWGAGNTAVLNHQGMLREDLYRELRVEAFLDSGKAGTELFGFPVFSPDILDERDPAEAFVLICTTNPRVYREIEALCRRKGVSSALLDGAILRLRRERYLEAAELLDPESRAVYHQVLKNRMTADLPEPALYAGESYFGIPEFCRCNGNDVILDCGAYVGDSAERYLWRMEQFRRYIAVEPDEGNYRAMEKRFARLREEWNLPEDKLVARCGGVDEKTRMAGMENRVGGLGSIAVNASENGSAVPFWAVDDLLPEGFTFLKADIESYEYRMLLGAEKSIRRYHPRMAVCIYHNMVDMYSIPLLIHSCDPTYRLAVRHHSYGYEETVLYAY